MEISAEYVADCAPKSYEKNLSYQYNTSSVQPSLFSSST